VEPWEHSGPNVRTLVAAQQEYLSETRPNRHRPGKVRPPKRREARDPAWRPIELTDDLMARVQRTKGEEQRYWDEEHRRAAQEMGVDPEGPFKEYNTAMQSLGAEAATMTHREVKARMRDLGHEHDFALPNAYLEPQSRLMKSEDFFHHHPVHAIWWFASLLATRDLQATLGRAANGHHLHCRLS